MIRLDSITPACCSVMQRRSRQFCGWVPPPPNDRPTRCPGRSRSRFSQTTRFCSKRLPSPPPLAKAPKLMRSPPALTKSLMLLPRMVQWLAATRSMGVTGLAVRRSAVLRMTLPSIKPWSGERVPTGLILKCALKSARVLLRATKCVPPATTWNACSQYEWSAQVPRIERFSKIQYGALTRKPSLMSNSRSAVPARSARTVISLPGLPGCFAAIFVAPAKR